MGLNKGPGTEWVIEVSGLSGREERVLEVGIASLFSANLLNAVGEKADPENELLEEP